MALATSDPVSATRSGQPGVTASDSPAVGQPNKTDDSNRPDKWRYRWQNGRWWYWTASNHWLYWSEPKGWIAYQPPARAQGPRSRAPAGDSWRWGWDPANPFDRYPPGRPINSPRMFPKNM